MKSLLSPLALLALVVAGLPPAAVAAPAPPAGPPSPRVRELQNERVQALKEHLAGQYERVMIGKDPLVTLLDCLRDLAEAEADLADTPAARVAALEKAVGRFREVEADFAKLVGAGLQTKQSAAHIRAARLKAEIELEKWKPAK